MGEFDLAFQKSSFGGDGHAKTKGSGNAANLGLRASSGGARAFACVLPAQSVFHAEISIGLGNSPIE